MKRYYFIYLLATLFYFSCTNGTRQKTIINKSEINEDIKLKPSSGFSDTVKINSPVAVFFKPDSLQFEKIKAITDSAIFESMEHDCFYQMRYAGIAIKRLYPKLTILEIKKVRYLLFEYDKKGHIYIDLDKKDPCGIFIFDGHKAPLFVDMTNLESELGFYFDN